MAFPSVTYTFTNGSTADASQVNQNFTDIINGISDTTKDMSVSALTAAGTSTLNGNVILGNASGKTITVNGSLSSNFLIAANTTYNLGSATLGLLACYIGGTSTFTTAIKSAATASWTLNLPVTAGTSGYTLITDGSGNTSWAPGIPAVSAKTTTYPATTSDSVILCSASAFTVTLPTAVGISGKQYFIQKTDSTLANIITVATTSSQTIGNPTQTTYTLATQGESISVVSDNANWQIISRVIPDIKGTTLFTFVPNASGYGTITGAAYYCWREGRHLCARIAFNNGTAAGASANVVFPSGVVLDTGGLVSGNKNIVGTWVMADTTTANNYPNRAGLVWVRPANTDRIYLSLDNGSSTLSDNNVTQITGTSGSFWNIEFKIPVSGWIG